MKFSRGVCVSFTTLSEFSLKLFQPEVTGMMGNCK